MPRIAIDEEVGFSPLETGRLRYQKKDYQGALKAFNEAVKINTEYLLLTALDHRAATYEKLDQLQAALKDAKQMLELKPELSKGYLRCGKVLQLKGEHKLALKIYERGLNKVKIGTDKERITLQSMFNKLQQSQAPRKTLDPLQYLPLELAEMVAEQLSMRDRVVCLAVNKSWKRLLESSHNLWTIFDTSRAKRSISHKAFRSYLKRSNYNVGQAILSTNVRIDSEKLQYLTRTCKKLQHLSICGSDPIGATLLSALPMAKSLKSLKLLDAVEITGPSLLAALKHVQETLEFGEFHSTTVDVPGPNIWPQLNALRSLYLARSTESVYGSSLTNLFDSIPNIEILSLKNFVFLDPRLDFMKLKSLQHLELVSMGLHTLPVLPLTLKHLILDDNLNLFTYNYDETKLPDLETFSCERSGLNDAFVKSIAKKASNLKYLAIGERLHTNGVSDFPSCDMLIELSLRSAQYSESDLIEIVIRCPKLERLNVACTKVTGVAVKRFVKQGIKSINLDRCLNVSNDAIEYARGKDVKVSSNMSDRTRPNFRDQMAARMGY